MVPGQGLYRRDGAVRQLADEAVDAHIQPRAIPVVAVLVFAQGGEQLLYTGSPQGVRSMPDTLPQFHQTAKNCQINPKSGTYRRAAGFDRLFRQGRTVQHHRQQQQDEAEGLITGQGEVDLH